MLNYYNVMRFRLESNKVMIVYSFSIKINRKIGKKEQRCEEYHNRVRLMIKLTYHKKIDKDFTILGKFKNF